MRCLVTVGIGEQYRTIVHCGRALAVHVFS